MHGDPVSGCSQQQYIRIDADTYSCDRTEEPGTFRDVGKAFGRFQYLLRDFPAGRLHETIPGFHDTPYRYRQLHEAVSCDLFGRAANAEEEIRFALEYERIADVLVRAAEAGRIPVRVTHNDTKMNNVLIDRGSGRAICIVDLDTVMPGVSLNDFGDAIRSGAVSAAEDERDPARVHFDLDMYEAFRDGFVEGCGGMLTQEEIRLFTDAAVIMTLECGVRFLTDYLEGDIYFKTAYQEHNLIRCRNQFKLAAEMMKSLK